jgi:lipoyl(octanoyl) transferase
VIPVEWWGSDVPYVEAWERQRRRRAGVWEGGPEVLALLEHRAVVTTGRRSVEVDDREVVRTERGGLATWHGPGQLVGYLVCDLRSRGLGARATVRAIEQGLIDFLGGDFGRRDGYPGVWHRLGKIASIGLHFSRGVSIHGFALNLRVSPCSWRGLTPCGITDARPVSLHEIRPGAPTPEEAHGGIGEGVVGALTQQAGGYRCREPERFGDLGS